MVVKVGFMLLAISIVARGVALGANTYYVDKISGTKTYYPTLPPHAALPTGDQCARDVLNFDHLEVKPANAGANMTVPTKADLDAINFYGTPFEGGTDMVLVTGNFRGTTTQVLRWAACKNGLDENAMMADAVVESGWDQAGAGDWRSDPALCKSRWWNGWGTIPNRDTQSNNGCYQSYGILQVKVHDYNTWPWSHTSTAFNADFRMGELRNCMNGDFSDYFSGPHAPVISGYPTYAQAIAGQLAPGSSSTTETLFWGCMGAWFSGSWYDANGLSYIKDVRRHLAAKDWPH
jgi:hypothetical protein